jgi:hypothetical protein
VEIDRGNAGGIAEVEDTSQARTTIKGWPAQSVAPGMTRRR